MAGQGTTKQRRGGRGFRHTGTLLSRQVKETGQDRGFLETRILTHWPEIVGKDTANLCRPVEVSHRQGFGATLVLLSSGSNAPVIEMQRETIRDRVNAVYGYSAITKVRITQTSRYGFGEDATPFSAAAPVPKEMSPDPQALQIAKNTVRPIEDERLRSALQTLGAHVMAAKTSKKGQSK